MNGHKIGKNGDHAYEVPTKEDSLAHGTIPRQGFEFEKRTGRRLWQFEYYDRILRGNDSANRVAWYIRLNPVRKGLCRERHEYPFAGSFTEIGKKMFSGSAPPEWSPPWKREKVSNES